MITITVPYWFAVLVAFGICVTAALQLLRIYYELKLNRRKRQWRG